MLRFLISANEGGSDDPSVVYKVSDRYTQLRKAKAIAAKLTTLRILGKPQ